MTAPERPSLRAILRTAAARRASDVHLRVGSPAGLRIDGRLEPLRTPPLQPADTRAYVQELLGSLRHAPAVDDLRELDFSYTLAGLGRFRVNLFRQRGTLAAVLRLVPSQIPALGQLGLPPGVHRLAQLHRGLVLVTGATGSGKSTTLAALVDTINQSRSCHILTIEDPIEFVFTNRQASISQREVGSDTDDFRGAFRAALRQDPDVILVGEMRDRESVEMALAAAETGHLVLSTLHTTDALRTVNRLLSFFDGSRLAEARDRLGDALAGIVSQRLLPAQGGGRVPAVEILMSTLAVREILRTGGNTLKLVELMKRDDGSHGMQTFDQHLIELHRGGRLSYEVALRAATRPSDFKRQVALLEVEDQVAGRRPRSGPESDLLGGRLLDDEF